LCRGRGAGQQNRCNYCRAHARSITESVRRLRPHQCSADLIRSAKGDT
jgi:hypothetical protein